MVIAARNQESTPLATAVRTETVDSPEQDNPECRGGHVIIDVTEYPAAASITPKIQGKDPASGTWYDILVGLAITETGWVVLKVYPGIVAIANVAASDVLPKTWRVRMEHADADSITYSAGAGLVV